MDPETKQGLTDAEHVQQMLFSRGWAIVKEKLDTLILDLQNINNIDASSTDNMIADLKARKMASETLYNWLKQDVYGFIEQQKLVTPKHEPESDIIDLGKQ